MQRPTAYAVSWEVPDGGNLARFPPSLGAR